MGRNHKPATPSPAEASPDGVPRLAQRSVYSKRSSTGLDLTIRPSSGPCLRPASKPLPDGPALPSPYQEGLLKAPDL